MSFTRSARTSLSGIVMVVFVFCALSLPAAAAPVFSVNITVNENGNGTLTNSSGFSGTLPFSQITDPGPTGKPGVANYGLLSPPGLVGGDLVLLDSGTIADLIRFDPVTNGGSLFFYSDLDGGVNALADIGIPSSLNTNLIRLAEVDIGGGVFGLVYTPTAGQPGFVANAGGPVTYTIISDVPEPASVVLIGSGAALLVLLRRLRAPAFRA